MTKLLEHTNWYSKNFKRLKSGKRFCLVTKKVNKSYHVTEVMSKRLSTCIGSTKSMHRINFSLFRITLCGNNCKQLHLFHVLRGETSRDLIYSFRACYENCMHRRTCVVSKCVVAWKTVPFHDEKLMKNTLYIPETIPSRTETRKKTWFLRYWFSGFNSKNKHDHIINNMKVFFYLQCLVDVVATARSNDAQCSVAFPENKRRRIS